MLRHPGNPPLPRLPSLCSHWVACPTTSLRRQSRLPLERSLRSRGGGRHGNLRRGPGPPGPTLPRLYRHPVSRAQRAYLAPGGGDRSLLPPPFPPGRPHPSGASVGRERGGRAARNLDLGGILYRLRTGPSAHNRPLGPRLSALWNSGQRAWPKMGIQPGKLSGPVAGRGRSLRFADVPGQTAAGAQLGKYPDAGGAEKSFLEKILRHRPAERGRLDLRQ